MIVIVYASVGYRVASGERVLTCWTWSALAVIADTSERVKRLRDISLFIHTSQSNTTLMNPSCFARLQMPGGQTT
jgi:hypothetical protein